LLGSTQAIKVGKCLIGLACSTGGN
jgi:hypothetical protein